MNATILQTSDAGATARPLDIARPVAAPVSVPAASWSAIIAGAFVAAAASLILFALGSGLGFAWLPSWRTHEAPTKTFAVTAAIWLIVSQWISSGLGGYIAGRLRSRWIGTHVHEVFFRDTAHGLVTWAVATVAVAAVAAGSIVSGVDVGARSAAAGLGANSAVADNAGLGTGPNSAGAAAPVAESEDYSIDKLFRPAPEGGAAVAMSAPAALANPANTASTMPANATNRASNTPALTPAAAAASTPAPAATVERQTRGILAHAIATGSIPDVDRSWLTDQVVSVTGISQSEAQSRVDSLVSGVFDEASKQRAAAEAATKAAAEASIYLALSMLIGAFISCVSAALGGRLRDEHP
jgi:hypothetical protein